MSFSTLVTWTVIEIVLLVLVLAVFLIIITRGLRRISDTLGRVAFGVRAVEQQASKIGPGVSQLNGTLERIANVLPGIAGRAESLAGRR
ncbi:MAG: hypothetical protein M3O70_24770 [Actinomycetota bacterium]|nr:hypothetical protein [Actinomycetota bacterium]